MAKPVIAVDFGTSTILVAIRTSPEDPDPTIPIGEVTHWMPSLVGVDQNGTWVYGEEADRLPPSQVIRSIKTSLGANEETVSIERPSGNTLSLKVDDLILGLLREALARARNRAAPNVKLHLDPPFRIHMCCPADWTSEPRLRLERIVSRAGLKASVDEIVDEPIAAGISWVMGNYGSEGEFPGGRTLVFDCGGGTLDVAVIDVTLSEGASAPEINVLSAGALNLAGDYLDDRIFEKLWPKLSDAERSGTLSDAEVEQLAKRAARELKHLLSDSDEASVRIPGLREAVRYTRPELEKAFQPQLNKAIRFAFTMIRTSLIRNREVAYGRIRAMKQKKLAAGIDHILLSGGMSHIPLIREELKRQFGREPMADPFLTDPEKSVISGLTYEDAVASLNLHRPGFDFVAEFFDGNGTRVGKQVLYAAFTPFYRWPAPFLRNTDLGFETVLEPPPGAESVKVICMTASGKRVPLQIQGTGQNKIELELDPKPVNPKNQRFKLYVDGRLVIRAGSQELLLDIPKWPHLGAGQPDAVIASRRDPRQGWWGLNDPIEGLRRTHRRW